MKLPKINLKELEIAKKRNFEQRMDFIDSYSKWVKKSSNKKWSSQQQKIID